MSIWNEEELKRYNKEKLKKLKSEHERLSKKAENCEIKYPIINNGYRICQSELDCNS